MKRIIGMIPNTITCLNLLSGCLACIFALHFSELYGSMHGFTIAFILIGCAAVFDFCDGFAARALHAYSPLGKELDSLADLVSFGVAPGMLVYSLLTLLGAGPLAFLALFIPVMGALRLAKFNIDDRQTTSFIGLPIPANAIFWIGAISWAVAATGIDRTVTPQAASLVILMAVVIVPLLMVSGLKMFSLKFKNLGWRENFRRYAIIAAAVLFVATCGLQGLAWTIILYLILSALLPQR
jgi:CDP-diacylglycerol--serine O-phosphatidyltransferase